jgi:hypothetical protein
MIYKISITPANPSFYSYSIKFSYDDKKQGRMRITVIGYESYLTNNYEITDEFGSLLIKRHCSTAQIWKIQELLANHCRAHETGSKVWECIDLHRDASTDSQL